MARFRLKPPTDVTATRITKRQQVTSRGCECGEYGSDNKWAYPGDWYVDYGEHLNGDVRWELWKDRAFRKYFDPLDDEARAMLGIVPPQGMAKFEQRVPYLACDENMLPPTCWAKPGENGRWECWDEGSEYTREDKEFRDRWQPADGNDEARAMLEVKDGEV